MDNGHGGWNIEVKVTTVLLTQTQTVLVVRVKPALQARASVPPCRSVTGWETGWRRRRSAPGPPTPPLSPPSTQPSPARCRMVGRRWCVTTVPGLSTDQDLASSISTTLILISALISTTGEISLSFLHTSLLSEFSLQICQYEQRHLGNCSLRPLV